MRIEILHYTKPPVIGGVERVIRDQVVALQAVGHDVTLWSADDPSAYTLGVATERGHLVDAVIVHNVFTMPFNLAWTRRLHELAAAHPEIRWINWVHDVAAVNPNYAHLPWETPEMKRPRGFFCAIGKCSSCFMVVDGVPNVRTCVTALSEGMKVETQRGKGLVPALS